VFVYVECYFFFKCYTVFFKWEWWLLVDEQQCVAAVSPEQERGKCSRVCNMVLGFCYSGGVISYRFISVIKYFTCSVKGGGSACPTRICPE